MAQHRRHASPDRLGGTERLQQEGQQSHSGRPERPAPLVVGLNTVPLYTPRRHQIQHHRRVADGGLASGSPCRDTAHPEPLCDVVVSPTPSSRGALHAQARKCGAQKDLRHRFMPFLSDTKPQLDQVLSVLERLDVPAEQPAIESIETRNLAAKQLQGLVTAAGAALAGVQGRHQGEGAALARQQRPGRPSRRRRSCRSG